MYVQVTLKLCTNSADYYLLFCRPEHFTYSLFTVTPPAVAARLCIEVFIIKVKVQTSRGGVIQFHLSGFVYTSGTIRTIADGPVTLKVEMRNKKETGPRHITFHSANCWHFLVMRNSNVSIQILPRKHQRGICKGSWQYFFVQLFLLESLPPLVWWWLWQWQLGLYSYCRKQRKCMDNSTNVNNLNSQQAQL